MENSGAEINVEEEKKEILKRYKRLLRAAQYSKSKEDRRKIRKAFEVAQEAHKDMRRKSGEPYIYHPIDVAQIVASEIGLGTTAIICALLHDTVEDTDITLEEVESMFGGNVNKIIDGLTKISEVIDQSPSIQAENFRKILLTLSDDIRVILIKIADRLHNMRTLESMRRDKQLKIASETLFLYAPLAHRLGLYAIKSELEDLALKYTEPEMFQLISQKLKKTKAVRTRFINQFSLPIKNTLTEMGFSFEIKGRTKSVYSILQKMRTKSIDFEEVYDVFALRIILNSPSDQEKADCWTAYSVVTDFYQPNPDRLRDWISTPRGNGYESLHCTVMSPSGKWVEVQIRSNRMDEIAEKGFAAHWKYKEGDSENHFDNWISKVRELLENPEQNALDFIDSFKLNLFSDEVHVFTPNGELRTLPVGATALDFAFDIHTQIGANCLGAKVNNKLVPLSHRLKSGDQVEIITSDKQKPKEDWLGYVVTARAKSKIKSALKESKKKFATLGRSELSKKLKKLKVQLTSSNINELLAYFHLTSENELYFQIATDKIDLKILDSFEIEKGKFIHKKNKNTIKKSLGRLFKIRGKKDENLVIGDDMQHFDYTLSKCCNPIPGDEVFGFITIGQGIKIHKVNCPNAVELMSHYAYRIVKAKWTNQEKLAFLSGIRVNGIDDMGVVNKITRIISNELSVNMRSISFDTNDGIFEGTIMVYVQDTIHLTELIKKLETMKGVISVSRIDSERRAS
jgi:guanosine-3',5'-bis(diphosphate) 3'-pyrophosphohydrolase